MRHGLTIVPAGLVLVAALLGAAGPESPPAGRASVSDKRFGMTIAPIHLLVRPDVQLDLQLNQQQVAGARDLLSRLIQRGQGVKHMSGDAALTERRRIDEAMAAWLRQELSEAQLERFSQINLQWEGASAIRRQNVAEYLGLDEPQRLKVDSLLAERDRRRADGVLTPADFDSYSKQAMGVLTPIQKEQWDNVLGPPCRFSIGQQAEAPKSQAGNPRLKARPQAPAR